MVDVQVSRKQIKHSVVGSEANDDSSEIHSGMTHNNFSRSFQQSFTRSQSGLKAPRNQHHPATQLTSLQTGGGVAGWWGGWVVVWLGGVCPV